MDIMKIITWLAIWLIIPMAVYEIGAYYVNETTTYDLPTIYGAYTREPNIRIENVYLLDNATGRIKDEIPQGGIIDFESTLSIRIDISISLPLTLSQYEITPAFDISDSFAETYKGISEPLEIGLSNIFIKEKSAFIVMNLPHVETWSGFIDVELRGPDGTLIILRSFQFAVVP